MSPNPRLEGWNLYLGSLGARTRARHFPCLVLPFCRSGVVLAVHAS